MSFLVPQRGADPLSRHRQSRVVRFFLLTNVCSVINRKYKLIKKKQILVKCVTPTAEESIKTAAEAKGDEKILCKVRGQDLIITVAAEIFYSRYRRKTRYTHRQRIMLHLNTSVSTFKYISKITGHVSGKVFDIHV